MGANTGQVVFNVIGTVVNFYYPGAGLLFSYAGQALFPTQIKAPALGDLSVVTSSAGASIPILFGKPKPIAGNIIFFAEPRVEEVTESTKGGPEITSQTRFFNFAVLLCEGPIFAISRIWANGQIVYDVSEGATEEAVAASESFADYFTFYPGNGTQLPDPTMESYLGAGNVPAHRGSCYVVFNDLPGAKFFEFELIENGTDVDAVAEENDNDVLYPWDETLNPPLDCRNEHQYAYFPGSVGTWRDTLDEAKADLLAAQPAGANGPDRIASYVGWSVTSNNDQVMISGDYAPSSPYTLTTGEDEYIALHYNVELKPAVAYGDLGTMSSLAQLIGQFDMLDVCCRTTPVKPVWWSSEWDGSSTPAAGIWVGKCNVFTMGVPWASLGQTASTCGPNLYALGYYAIDLRIAVRRKPRQPPNPCEPYCEDEHLLLPENPNYCVIDGSLIRNLAYTQVFGDYRALQAYTVSGAPGTVTKYPLGPAILATSPDNTQAFWEAAYAADQALAVPFMAAGLVYGVDYPVTKTYAWERTWTRSTVAATPITLGSIVDRVCQREGMVPAEFDVTALDETVIGYIISQSMSGREAITPLTAFGFFDGADVNGQILFSLRARNPDVVVTMAEMGAFEVGGSPSSLFTIRRKLDEELPKSVRVNHNQVGLNTPGHQEYTRQLTNSTNLIDLNLAITMTGTKAAQIAETLCNEAWTGRQSCVFSCSAQRKDIYPSRIVSVEMDDATYVVRIGNRLYSPPGLIEFEAVWHNIDDYTSDALGGTQPIYNDELSVAGPTEMVPIDGPALDSSSNDPGVFAACRGLLANWPGCSIQRSDDGGSTYAEVASVTVAATMGRIVAAMPTGPVTIFDRGSTLQVVLDNGTLASSTEAGVLNGANAAFIGAAGRWELIQFVTATLVSGATYDLSTFMRGRRGTEWAVGDSEANDRFVLVGPGLTRLVDTETGIDATRLYKAVTLRTTVAAAAAKSIDQAGVALEPYSVVHIEGARDNQGGIVIEWKRRTRISGEWLDRVDVPLNEATEAYEADVIKADGSVARTLSSTEPLVVYALSQQYADFGGIQSSLDVVVYQMSDKVGRGYASAATVTANTTYEDDDGDPITPDDPTTEVTITFGGTFSTADIWTVELVQRVSNETFLETGILDYRGTYTVSGSGKTTLAQFANDLAEQIVADFEGPISATMPTTTSVKVTASGGYVRAYVTGAADAANSFKGVIQQAGPADVANQNVQLHLNLYTPVAGTGGYELSPEFSPSYLNVGTGRTSHMSIYGMTYAAEKTLLGGNYFNQTARPEFELTWATPAGSQQSHLSALTGIIDAVSQSDDLAPYTPVATVGAGGPQSLDSSRQGVNIQLTDHFVIDWNVCSKLSFQGNRSDPRMTFGNLPADWQPSGYRLGTFSRLVSAATADVKQIDIIRWKTNDELADTTPVVSGSKFTAVLDGVSYTYTATAGDATQLYFTGIYAGLKALIDASGLFTCTLVDGMNTATDPTTFTDYMEIERNTVNTSFTSAYFASRGGQVTITGS